MKQSNLLSKVINLAILFMLVWVAYALVSSAQDDNTAHQNRVQFLFASNAVDAQLNQFALKIIAADMPEYDELVTLTKNLDNLKSLTNAQISPFATTTQDLQQKVTQYFVLLDEKMQQLERMKTAASLMRNTLLYLPQLNRELQLQGDKNALLAQQLYGDVLTYNFHADELKLAEIQSKLAAIKDKGQSPLIKNLEQHLQVQLAQQHDLKQLYNAFVATQSKSAFNTLNSSYNRYHLQKLQSSKENRQLTLLLSAALLLTLIIIFRRLNHARFSAFRSGKLLKEALTSIEEGFALFDKNNQLILSNHSWFDHHEIDQNNAPKTLKQWQRLQSSQLINKIESHNQTLHCSLAGKWIRTTLNQAHDGATACVSVDVTSFKHAEETLKKWGHAIEQSPVSIVITDTRGKIEYVNPKFERITGYRLEEVLGKTPRVLRSELTATDYRALWHELKEKGQWRGEFHNQKKNGEHYWEQARISAIRDQAGKVTHYIAVKEDITEQKHAHAKLKTAAAVFNATQEGIMTTNSKLEITAINPAFSRITGYSSNDVLGKKPSMLSSGKHDKSFYEQMWQTLSEKDQWASEIWNKRKDGSLYPEWLSISAVRDEDGDIQQYIAVISDITERKTQEEKIQYQAYYDALTGLPNRSLLLERISQSLLYSQRYKQLSALLFIDLDRFKRINDTMGHEAGDALLIEVSTRLNHIVRKSDTVSRFGGDEFVILLNNIASIEHCTTVAQKIINEMSKPFVIHGFEIFSGASIGITLLPEDADNSKELLRLADLAMYKAKENGRNQFHFFAKSMQQQVNRRVELEHKLRNAIKNQELNLFYQPIVDTQSASLYGVEALMRWQLSDGSFISPEEFIPVAEESGLINEMGEWLIKQACSDIQLLNLNCDCQCMLSVNVSSQQYRLGFNAEILSTILNDTQFNANLLNLEITESILLDNDQAVMNWLQDLRATGAQLAIDDFGTGYSSLSYLRRFPINTIKIDRSFISDLTASEDSAVLVKAIVSMADSLNLKVIAEGVENKIQLKSLNDLGGQYVQGYFYAKPLPIDALQTWVNTHICHACCKKGKLIESKSDFVI
ncbi:EAL domain-containing protein [Pseudoalteromonas phenolica]|uniref:EAL domain-containing protein n=1 Tax=Pseudoalteromonas phenolica TaxID=161398 RepID=UPI00110A8DE5|nr:EAL domain-containing protein [Pseudoalteromonas phenolica]TMO54137.1 GGDEF domain-containing protein [Pseudoalteromonas phenolica]